MSSFPLYDNLNQQTENITETLTPDEKSMLSDNIKGIDNDGHKMIYALIRYFQMKHFQNNGVELHIHQKNKSLGINLILIVYLNSYNKYYFFFLKFISKK